jgi:hypothetical protein
VDKSGIKYWADCNDGVVWIDNIPWQLRNRILLPLGMPHTIPNDINRNKVQEAVNDTKALLAYWTDQWDSEHSEWWWTCCDNRNYNIENIENSSGKRGIRKGISYCSVRRIDANDFADMAYSLYTKALESYGLKNSKIPSKDEYKQTIIKQSKYSGFELWGAFVKEQLAAFSTCIIIDGAVNLGSTKSDPELHKYYPNNALFYNITRHYLQKKNILYVTNGYRTLLHPTSINDFLIRMGYRRIYCRLNIELSYFAKLLINSGVVLLGKHIKKIFPDLGAKVNGLLKLIEISKTF